MERHPAFCPSVNTAIRPDNRLPSCDRLTANLSLCWCLSLSVCLPVCLFVSLSVCISVYIYVCRSSVLSIHRPSSLSFRHSPVRSSMPIGPVGSSVGSYCPSVRFITRRLRTSPSPGTYPPPPHSTPRNPEYLLCLSIDEELQSTLLNNALTYAKRHRVNQDVLVSASSSPQSLHLAHLSPPSHLPHPSAPLPRPFPLILLPLPLPLPHPFHYTPAAEHIHARAQTAIYKANCLRYKYHARHLAAGVYTAWIVRVPSGGGSL